MIPINWLSLAYTVAAFAARSSFTVRCDVCSKQITKGQLAIRGPRGKRWAHAACAGRGKNDEAAS